MPSTLVHVAVAGLVGTALLGEEFDGRAIAVVLLVAATPDLDAFTGLVFPGSHRSLLHTLLYPAGLGAVLWYDTRVRTRSLLRGRYGHRGVYVAWVALAGLLFGGILPDMFTNGVNALYPLHDAFYTVNGKLLLSDQRGVVQTFVELSPEKPARTTKNLRYVTGVNPSPGSSPQNAERVFPVAMTGLQLLLILASGTVVSVRLWLRRLSGERTGRGRTGQERAGRERPDGKTSADGRPAVRSESIVDSAGDGSTGED